MTSTGWTSLLIASRYGFTEIVKLLLDADPLRPNELSRSGWHPAHLALRAGHLDTLRLLINSRLIDLTVPSSNGRTLFDMLEAITVEDPHYDELLQLRDEVERRIEAPDEEEGETLDDLFAAAALEDDQQDDDEEI